MGNFVVPISFESIIQLKRYYENEKKIYSDLGIEILFLFSNDCFINYVYFNYEFNLIYHSLVSFSLNVSYNSFRQDRKYKYFSFVSQTKAYSIESSNATRDT